MAGTRLIKEIDKLNMKNYQLWDKQFMCFGSVCNGLSGSLTKEDLDFVWNWCHKSAKELLDMLYQNNGEEEETPL